MQVLIQNLNQKLANELPLGISTSPAGAACSLPITRATSASASSSTVTPPSSGSAAIGNSKPKMGEGALNENVYKSPCPMRLQGSPSGQDKSPVDIGLECSVNLPGQ